MKKTVIAFGTAAVVLFGSSLVANPVSAERLQDLKSEKQQINSELTEVEKKIKGILLEIQKIHNEVVELENEIKENQKLIKEVEEAIEEYEEQIIILEERIEERNEVIKSRIASYQEAGGNVKFLEVILGSKGMEELISRVTAMTTITKADEELMKAQQEDMIEVEEKLIVQEEMRIDLEEAKQILDSNLAEKKEAEKKEAKKEAELKKEKNKLESDLQSVSSEIINLEAEIRAAMAAPAPAAATNNTSNSNNNSNGGDSSQKSNTTSVANIPPSAGGGSAISRGMSVLGTPYRTAGKGPGGFDCSGFVAWAYGGSIPSYTGALRSMGTKVSKSEAQPGDLVFFNTVGTDTHVGIYLGNNQFIASNTSKGVEIKSLSDHYWRDTFKGHIRRVK